MDMDREFVLRNYPFGMADEDKEAILALVQCGMLIPYITDEKEILYCHVDQVDNDMLERAVPYEKLKRLYHSRPPKL